MINTGLLKLTKVLFNFQGLLTKIYFTRYTPSIVYKRHAIRDTSQIFEKNKRQRLVSAINFRDS